MRSPRYPVGGFTLINASNNPDKPAHGLDLRANSLIERHRSDSLLVSPTYLIAPCQLAAPILPGLRTVHPAGTMLRLLARDLTGW
jgi:hypothetical protein